jgi:hypothetical protein
MVARVVRDEPTVSGVTEGIMNAELIGGRLVFHDGDKERAYSMPYPDDEKLHESIRSLIWNRTTATEADVNRVVACVEAYRHFATHPAPTESLIRQLRELRRAVKARRKARP